MLFFIFSTCDVNTFWNFFVVVVPELLFCVVMFFCIGLYEVNNMSALSKKLFDVRKTLASFVSLQFQLNFSKNYTQDGMKSFLAYFSTTFFGSKSALKILKILKKLKVHPMLRCILYMNQGILFFSSQFDIELNCSF